MNYGLCKMRPCGNTTLYKYAHAVNGNDLAATDRNYKNDSDEEKAWNYRCSSLKELSSQIFQFADIRIFRKNTIAYEKVTSLGMQAFNQIKGNRIPNFETKDGVLTFNVTSARHSFSQNASWWSQQQRNFNFPKLTSGHALFFQCYNLPILTINIPLCKDCSYLCSDNRTITLWKNPLPSATNIENTFYVYGVGHGVLSSFEVPLPKVTNGKNAFQYRETLKDIKYPIDEDGNCIYESGKEQVVDENGNLMYKYLTLPNLSNGENMFDSCRLDRPSIISILNSLPTYTSGSHLLTMGTHIDNKAEAETEGTELHTLINTTVPNKGWTLTMQYNGTLSTGIAMLDLEPIYAKLEENEYGMYKNDETGKCYDLTWGNIIKSPDGKSPIEMGYEECYSIDEIIEKYNLRYIEPEEVKLPPFEEELNNTEQ